MGEFLVRWPRDANRRMAILLAVVVGAALLAACRSPAMPAGAEPITTPSSVSVPALTATPTVTSQVVSASPSAQLTATRGTPDSVLVMLTATVPVATPTAERPVTPEPTPVPTVVPSARLVYMVDGAVMIGDVIGAGARPVATIEPADAWALCPTGLLALARGDSLQVLDLAAHRGIIRAAPVEGEVLNIQLLWGERCETLLYAALVEEGAAEAPKRRLAMSVVRPSDAYVSKTYSTVGEPEMRVLGYREAGDVYVVFRKDDRTAWVRHDVLPQGAGQLAYDLPEGQTDLALDTDGFRLVSQSRGADGVFTLCLGKEEGGATLKEWRLPEGALATTAVWSPDAQRVAVLLEEVGDSEETRGRGLWVLDATAWQGAKAVDVPMVGARLVGWTPEGGQIMGFQRIAESVGFYYVVRPDGGGYRILPLSPASVVLGWMEGGTGG